MPGHMFSNTLKVLRAGFAALTLAATALTGLSAGAAAAEANVTFVLINDIYKFEGSKLRGGMSRVAAVIKAERARGKNVLVAHGGDFISPSLLSGFDQGEHMVKLMNMTPLDVFVPGNHEFDFGPATFLKRMGELQGAKLAANLRDPKGEIVAGFADTKMFTYDGVKVGVVGIALDETPDISSSEDYKFADSLKIAYAGAKTLREQGANFIVAVVHLDRERDMKLIQSGQFDLVLTGHNHDLDIFYNGRSALVESKEEGEYVTAIDVAMKTEERDGRTTTTWWPNFRIVDTATVTPDPQVEAVVETYRKELSKELDIEVAKTAIELDSRKASVRSNETAMGNLIADAMRATTRADAAITNGGGIRGNKLYAPGSGITRRDILSELPFGNKTVLLEVTGEAIMSALENGVSVRGEEAGRFPQTSGMTITVDLTKPVGSRVTSVEIAGKPIDPKATYRLATNDFMARGGDGYRAFINARQLLGGADGKLMAADVMAYARTLGTINTKVDGRLTLKE